LLKPSKALPTKERRTNKLRGRVRKLGLMTKPCLLAPLIVFGPSGAGKGTLIAKLQEAFPGRLGFSVSHTTRAARPGEVDGEHYHFTSQEDMKRRVAGGEFVEHAQVHANAYGTSKMAVERVQHRGQLCILDIDVQGVQQIKDRSPFPDARFLFVSPSSLAKLEERLRGRQTEREDQIARRLANAEGEMAYGKLPGSADATIVNEDLDSSTRQLIATVRSWYPSLGSQRVEQVLDN